MPKVPTIPALSSMNSGTACLFIRLWMITPTVATTRTPVAQYRAVSRLIAKSSPPKTTLTSSLAMRIILYRPTKAMTGSRSAQIWFALPAAVPISLFCSVMNDLRVDTIFGSLSSLTKPSWSSASSVLATRQGANSSIINPIAKTLAAATLRGPNASFRNTAPNIAPKTTDVSRIAVTFAASDRVKAHSAAP